MDEQMNKHADRRINRHMLGKTWTQIDRQTDIWRDEQEEI
jgi:hypothetical protein